MSVNFYNYNRYRYYIKKCTSLSECIKGILTVDFFLFDTGGFGLRKSMQQHETAKLKIQK
jgi:hypothetical protein